MVACSAPMLVVLGGLPGVGKSSIAHALLSQWHAVYLRIDTIEQALRDSNVLTGGNVGAAGYMVAYALARTQLAQGLPVLADCVNPLPVTRDAWRSAAKAAQVPWLFVEVVCTDATEHRRRVETRVGDVAGLVLPAWDSVQSHDYTPWADGCGRRLLVDTARLSAWDAAALVLAALQSQTTSRTAAPLG